MSQYRDLLSSYISQLPNFSKTNINLDTFLPKDPKMIDPNIRKKIINSNKFELKKQDFFPIQNEKHLNFIKDYILNEKNNTLAICSSSGSGKKIYLPFFFSINNFKVRVVSPSSSALKFAYKQNLNKENISVSFIWNEHTSFDIYTQLIYATTTVYIQKLLYYIKNKKLNEAKALFGDIFFIDDKHTNNSDITSIIGLIKYLFTDENNKYNGPKIIFLTSTLNISQLTIFFPNTYLYSIDVKSHNSDIFYLDKGFNPLKEDVNPEIYEIILKELSKFKNQIGLIFRPNNIEVNKTIIYLQNRFLNEPILFFSNSSDDTSNNMKIIVTSVADYIPNVNFVIDDLLMENLTSTSYGAREIILSSISQDLSSQRTSKYKTIYRLSNEEFWNHLNTFNVNEIEHLPLYNRVLSLINAQLDPKKILQISDQKYDECIKILKLYNMLDADIADYSLNIQSSYMICLAKQKLDTNQTNNDYKIIFRSTIAIAVMIDNYNSITLDQLESFRGKDDINTLFNFYWACGFYIINNDQDTFSKNIKDFSSKYSLNSKKIKHILSIISEIENKYSDYNISSLYPEQEKYSIYLEAINKIFSNVFARNLMQLNNTNDMIYKNLESGTFYQVDLNNFSSPYPEYIIPALLKRGIVNTVSIFIPSVAS